MRLYLIRHAESEANVRKVLDTALPGPPLTELGRQQAKALADRFSDQRFAAVYASHAVRARQTAEPLAMVNAVDVQLVEGVHEVTVGELEGRGDPVAIKTYLTVAGQWLGGEVGVAMPGGETGERVRDRFTTAVAELRAKHEPAGPDGAIALVSHGGVIRLGAEWLVGDVLPEAAEQVLLPNTGVVVLETTSEGGWTCLRWLDARSG
ncbi:MAG TPA: histidine phosphatase family protein [Amycolatopsis sp.]|nr:histidine phosphatase family protein [Amycolatopsis sp.]